MTRLQIYILSEQRESIFHDLLPMLVVKNFKKNIQFVITMDFMPISIAEFKFIFWLENSHDGTSPIINCECHGSINHLKNQIVSSALNGQKNSRDVAKNKKIEIKKFSAQKKEYLTLQKSLPWFDLHCDVKIQSNQISP